jgi:hypothetical protein
MATIDDKDGIVITSDKEKNLYHMIFLGRWEDTPDGQNYLTNVKAAVSTLNRGYTALVEIRDKKPPSLKATGMLKESQKIMVSHGVTKTAVVMAKSQVLQRMSLNVVGKLSGMDVKTFYDMNEAMAWLGLQDKKA